MSTDESDFQIPEGELKPYPSHSQLPWKVEKIGGTIRIVDAKGDDVGFIGDMFDEKQKVSFELIVNRVNNHERLVEALRKLLKFPENKYVKEEAKQALQSAEVK